MASWYIFTNTVGADPLNPSNYGTPQSSKPSCPGSVKICSVLADDDGFGHPNLTMPIQDDITRALQFSTDQTTAILRS